MSTVCPEVPPWARPATVMVPLVDVVVTVMPMLRYETLLRWLTCVRRIPSIPRATPPPVTDTLMSWNLTDESRVHRIVDVVDVAMPYTDAVLGTEICTAMLLIRNVEPENALMPPREMPAQMPAPFDGPTTVMDSPATVIPEN